MVCGAPLDDLSTPRDVHCTFCGNDFRAQGCCAATGVGVGFSLLEAAELSRDLLPIPLLAEAETTCAQFKQNKECIRQDCPFFPGSKRGTKGS